MAKLLNSSPNPWLKLLSLVGIIFIGAFIGQLLVGLWLGFPTNPIYQLPIDTQAYKNFVLGMQVLLTSSAFVGAPLLYWTLIEKKPIKAFFQWSQAYGYALFLTIGLVSAFMVVNTAFIHWNMQLQLPACLAGFEKWAQAKEAALKDLTELLTTFHSLRELFVGIFVLGMLPAIGEELLFRGILQPLLQAITKNIHVAVWISAFIFSAIHLQFYGLIPRFLLGILFGYIYCWTKDLSLAMVAHFYNNFFTLVALFLYQHAWINFDLAATITVPLPMLIGFGMISLLIAAALQKINKPAHVSKL